MSTLRNRRVAYSQNVLRGPRLVDRLLDRSGIAADDLVIEIGPGRDVITERLTARCRQVLAVEKDPVVVEALRARLAHAPNVAVFAADFLSLPLPLSTYKVFANIPFTITAAIVGKLTSSVGCERCIGPARGEARSDGDVLAPPGVWSSERAVTRKLDPCSIR